MERQAEASEIVRQRRCVDVDQPEMGRVRACRGAEQRSNRRNKPVKPSGRLPGPATGPVAPSVGCPELPQGLYRRREDARSGYRTCNWVGNDTTLRCAMRKPQVRARLQPMQHMHRIRGCDSEGQRLDFTRRDGTAHLLPMA